MMDVTIENHESSNHLNLQIDKKNISDYQHLLAGFWIRFWAYIIDLIVIGSINRMIVNPLFNLLGWDGKWFIFSPMSIAASLIFFAYFVLMTKYFQQTLGKMIFGIKVVSTKTNTLDWGTILFRELIGRYISKTIWILYLVVAFTPKKQGLHDIFADTQVFHEKLYTKYFRNLNERKNLLEETQER